MANTFSDVVDSIFARSLLALRKNTTLPRLCRTDWSQQVAQAGDTINVPLPPSLSVTDVSPANTPLAQSNHTRNVVAITLSNWRKTHMTLTDKEAREIADGARAGDVSAAMAVLAEDVNEKILAKYKEVYGYAGVAATTPFTNDLQEAIDANKILGDQKCPKADRHIVLGSAQLNDLFNITGFTSSDFVASANSPLQTGQIPGQLLGFVPHFTTIVANVMYLFHKSYMTMAAQQGMAVKEYDLGVDGVRASRVNTDTLIGVKQLDNKRIVTVG